MKIGGGNLDDVIEKWARLTLSMWWSLDFLKAPVRFVMAAPIWSRFIASWTFFVSAVSFLQAVFLSRRSQCISVTQFAFPAVTQPRKNLKDADTFGKLVHAGKNSRVW